MIILQLKTTPVDTNIKQLITLAIEIYETVIENFYDQLVILIKMRKREENFVFFKYSIHRIYTWITFDEIREYFYSDKTTGTRISKRSQTETIER